LKSSESIKVGLISLGCAKNLVDSEVMVGALLRDGMELTPEVSDADVVIINTCGFIEAAKKESIDAVLKANELRHTGRCRALIVAGCLPQRYPKDLQRDLLEVDALVGLNEVPQIAQIIRQVLERTDQPQAGHHGHDATASLHWSGPARFVPDFATPRYRLTPKHWAYVKIGEGCNHPCSFCSIPRIRGKYRSRRLADVVAEVRAFVADGVREINLISQDTTFYGRDLPGKQGLPELLRAIQQVDGDFWVRLLYTHPAHWSDELIDAIRESNKVCRYVDMPLQHINDALLARMRRETDGKFIRELVARLRERIPGIALRSTFIVGFPGETEAQFNELLDFLREVRFERVGVFAYSQEDHTPAGTMADQLPAKVKRDRHRQAMTVQQQVSRDVLRGFVGRTLRVLVEKPVGRGWLARSHADAPEIDATVKVRGAAQPGEFANVQITGATAYDLRGEIIRSC
jgi:ribosomal protein S12 methylthiotransferase